MLRVRNASSETQKLRRAVFLRTCPEALEHRREEEGRMKVVVVGGGLSMKPAYIHVFVCVPPTSEALTRPSWKEQLEGSWVHRLRYLHQWQRKALFTHDRHLHTHTHTRAWGVRERKKTALSRRGSEFAKLGGKCHRGNELRSRVGTCCSCALVVGTEPHGRWAKFSLHIFTTAVC